MIVSKPVTLSYLLLGGMTVRDDQWVWEPEPYARLEFTRTFAGQMRLAGARGYPTTHVVLMTGTFDESRHVHVIDLEGGIDLSPAHPPAAIARAAWFQDLDHLKALSAMLPPRTWPDDMYTWKEVR